MFGEDEKPETTNENEQHAQHTYQAIHTLQPTPVTAHVAAHVTAHVTEHVTSRQANCTITQFTCLYTNADTLMNKRLELEAQVAEMNPYIIAITEVNPKNTRFTIDRSELQMEGYELFENLERQGRGICVYIHHSLKPRRSDINDTTEFAECIWLNISLDGNSTLLLGCIYRSGRSDDHNNNKLMELIRKIQEQAASHVLMIGDFNFPNLTWMDDALDPINQAATDAQFLESTKDAFLFQHVHEPTRHRQGQTSNTLDLIFSNEAGMVSDVEVRDPLGKSDHCIITFQFHCNTTHITNTTEKYQYGNKGDYHQLRQMMMTEDWETRLAPLDAEAGWLFFTERLQLAQEACIPKKKAYLGTKPRRYRPLWMDNATLAKVKKKYHAWKRYIATKNGQDYLAFTRARNQARRATRQAAKSMEKNIAKDIKTSPKNFWKYVSMKTKTRIGIADLETGVNGNMTTSEAEKAEVLSKFFGEVFTREDLANVPYVTREGHITVTSTVKITEDVFETLSALKPNKSPGPDGIHPKVLRELADVIATPLNIIYNKSLSTGKIPESWKKANITPIYKKGNRHLPSNYRPISLTPVASKVMETLIRNALVAHMKENGLFANQQNGFMAGRSCTTQLLSTLDQWTRALDEDYCLDAIFLDFQKAFDTVPHHRLIRKLHGYGIDGALLEWIKSFLADRQQCVVVNGQKSAWTPVLSGVPQGSVLGPILFVIYINDLPEESTSDIQLFADDTKVYRTIRTPEDCLQLQRDLDNLQAWATRWQMKFHPQKCKVMRIGRGHPDFTYEMVSDGNIVPLTETHTEKDLGVWVDDSLHFRHQVQQATTKANQLLGIIRRTFNHLNSEILLFLYRGLVRPSLEYCVAAWAPHFQGDIDALERIQRRARRVWNSLPENVVKSPSINVFKNRLDKFWRNQDIKLNYKARHVMPTLCNSSGS